MSRSTALPLPALALALCASLLTACASTPDVTAPNLGSLQLYQTLQIEPDAASIRLQYGRIVARNAVQEQDPFCVFEIDTVRAGPQIVQPGVFSIIGVSRSVETFAGMPIFPYPLQIRRVSFSSDDSPTHIYYKTTFRLKDAQQPVRALTCMSNQNAPGNANHMRHLTMAEIRGALNNWFTLNLEAHSLRRMPVTER
jgi:hypothetical protein